MLIVTIDWVAVLVCGVAGGLLGALFAALVIWGNACVCAPGSRRRRMRRALMRRRLRPDRGAVRLSQQRRQLWHRL